MTHQEKFDRMVRDVYEQRVKKARKHKEVLTPLDLSKQHRAAEQEVLNTPEGLALSRAAAEEKSESLESKENRRQWDNQERVDAFARERAKMFEDG